MNGIPDATFFTFGAAAAAASVTKWDRVFAALMASCLLHMLTMIALLLGLGTSGGKLSAPRDPHPAGPPGVLEVRLTQGDDLPSAAGKERALPAVPRSAPERGSRASQPGRGIDLLPFPIQAFRTPDQLTKHPRPRLKPVFKVPAPVFTPGKVILKLWIDAGGTVLAVTIEDSSVPEALAAAAAAAFQQTPFVPGEIGGMHVASVMRIEVTYSDGGVTSYVKRSATP